ncbi:hypothetical protein GJ496_005248 [Pomphorhynchus laevis]|nr:hypothetical protein GJ496_005248 [Pomphorhynchus laevis]
MFCVKPDNQKLYDKIMIEKDLDVPNLILIPGMPDSMAHYEEIEHNNTIECLKIGKAYEERRRYCHFIDFMECEILNDKLIPKLNRRLNTNSGRIYVWNVICSKMNLIYDPILKMCKVSYSNKLARKTVMKAIVKNPYSGNRQDQHEKHLYCVSKGLNYNRNKEVCELYKININRKALYQKFLVIYKHAKEIICAELGQLYQPDLDVCIQPIGKQKKARTRTLPLIDPRWEEMQVLANRTEENYGPNLRLFTSSREYECFKRGYVYNKEYDRCSWNFYLYSNRYFLLAYRTKIRGFVHQMLRSHCFEHNLDYSKQLRVCISRKENKIKSVLINKTSEYKKELIKRTENDRFQLYQLRSCIAIGLDYDPIKEECTRYPEEINYINFYKPFEIEQMKIACINGRRIYLEHLNFCPPEMTDYQKALLNMNLNNDKIRFVREYCESKGMQFNYAIKVCVRKTFDNVKSRKPKNMHTEEILEKFCKTNGEIYNKTVDKCQSRFDTHYIRASQIKKMCHKSELEYDDRIGFCVLPRKPYELATPAVPDLRFVKSTARKERLCLAAGMMYINLSDTQCAHFPRLMNGTLIKHLNRTLKSHIDNISAQLCNQINLTYNSFLQFCIMDPKNESYRETVDLNYNFPTLNYTMQYCFLKGMKAIVKSNNLAFCVPFGKSSLTHEIKQQYAYYRDMFIHHRCPVYSTYDRQIGFCIRRPLKVFKIFEEKPISKFRKFLNLFSKKSKQVCDMNSSVMCCLIKGLDHSYEENACTNYRTKPTRLELESYVKKISDRSTELVAHVCKEIKQKFDKLQQICV